SRRGGGRRAADAGRHAAARDRGERSRRPRRRRLSPGCQHRRVGAPDGVPRSPARARRTANDLATGLNSIATMANPTSTRIVVPGAHSMVSLLGSSDELLRLVERAFTCDIHVRGNEITISGEADEVDLAARLFEELLTL